MCMRKKHNHQSSIEEVLTPEALAALPAEWLDTLKQGARRADFILLSSVIEQIYGHNASDMPVTKVLYEGHTSELRSVLADRSSWPVLEEDQGIEAGENSSYVFFFKADADATIDKTKTTLFVDTTLINI